MITMTATAILLALAPGGQPRELPKMDKLLTLRVLLAAGGLTLGFLLVIAVLVNCKCG
jgi:hypothetical protein